MPSDLATVLKLLPERHELESDKLSQLVSENFSGSLLSLKQLKPFIDEILRRFKCLPRKPLANGTYPMIAGYRTLNPVPAKCLRCQIVKSKHKTADHLFDADPKTGSVGWVKGVLGCNGRTVRYMLAGGNKQRKVSTGLVANIATVDAAAILRYVDNHVSDLDNVQRKLLAEGLSQAVGRLQQSFIPKESKCSTSAA